MKRVNKILISIFLISILVATLTTSAKDIDTPVPVSANISDKNITNPSDISVPEIEEAKLPTPAEEKARFEKRIKNTPRNLENITATPPSTIPTEVSYSNPVTGISTFGTYFNTGYVYTSDTVNWKTYSFYLPVASYVYIDMSGQMWWVSDSAHYAIYIDSDVLNDEPEKGSCNSGEYCFFSIQLSRLTYLAKGWHNIYLIGWANVFPNDKYLAFGYVSIIAQPEYTAITVTSPNGGESWAKGTTKTIKWKKIGQPGANVKIELYKAGALNSVISSTTTNDGAYSWFIPTFQPIGTDYKIKISSTSEPAKYYDWSNNNFRIY